MSARTAERGTEVRGTRIAVRRWRSDASPHRPVVLVPGLGLSGRYLAPTAERLAGRFDILCADPPGFGLSEAGPWPATPHALAAALATTIEHNRLEPVALVANSFGCQVATALAAGRPALVDRLVLSSPTLDPDLRTPTIASQTLFREQMTQSLRMRSIVASDQLRAGFRRVAAAAQAAFADPVEERLHRVSCPTLVVRGGRDPFVSRAWAERIVERLPDGRLVELPDAVHAMPHEQPEAFVTAIGAFLEGREPSDAADGPSGKGPPREGAR